MLISDINDNSPQFQQSSYSVQVSEALTLSSEILNILATDADYGSNAEVVYVIESHQPDLGRTIGTCMHCHYGLNSLSLSLSPCSSRHIQH